MAGAKNNVHDAKEEEGVKPSPELEARPGRRPKRHESHHGGHLEVRQVMAPRPNDDNGPEMSLAMTNENGDTARQ